MEMIADPVIPMESIYLLLIFVILMIIYVWLDNVLSKKEKQKLKTK
ncbi:MAG: hypothetical protein J7L47_08440 [Candidatus Odinarchaeota archaeon]|nr:hypothetical protein [Candidatus Odinarchaeota archaeon]